MSSYESLVATVKKEFLIESAIASEVFESAIVIKKDIEIDPLLNEVSETPLHDALGWKYTRFGHQVSPDLVGACFIDASGKVWQIKVFGGEKTDEKRSGNYYAPKGIGDIPYLPPITEQLAVRNLPFASCANGIATNFWEEIKEQKQIPLFITEGGKKVLSLLSVGEIAIGFYGCTCGTALVHRLRVPKSEILTQLYNGREVYIALDRDSNPKAARTVVKQIRRHAKAIQQAGGIPKIVLWDRSLGKGIDDVLKASENPKETIKRLKDNALSLEKWLTRNEYSLDRESNFSACTAKLSTELIPIKCDHKLVALKSPHGTGKTHAISEFVGSYLDKGIPIIGLVHLRSLERELANRLGLPTRRDIKESKMLGMTLCIDSLRPKVNGFNIHDWDTDELVLVIDEATQVVQHLLFGNGTDVGRYRVEIVSQLAFLLETCTKVVIMDADLDSDTVAFFEGLTGEKAYIIENTYKPTPFTLYNYNHSSDWWKELIDSIEAGNKPYIFSASAQPTSRFGTIAIESLLRKSFPSLSFIRVDGETLHDPETVAYKNRNRLEELFIETGAIPIVSPSICTGVSFDRYVPDAVFAINNGALAPNEFLQSIWRIRTPVPRYVFCEKSRAFKIGNGGHFAYQIRAGRKNKLTFLERLFGLFEDLEDFRESRQNLCNIWENLAARINRTSTYLRESFLSLVSRQGHYICDGQITDRDTRAAIGRQIADNRAIESIKWSVAAENSRSLTSQEAQRLEKYEVLTQTERRQLEKYHCNSRYGKVTQSLLLADKKGLYPKLRLTYFVCLPNEKVLLRDRRIVEKLKQDNNGKVYSFDIDRQVLSAKVLLLQKIKVDALLCFLKGVGEVRDDDPYLQEIASEICSAKNLLADLCSIQLRDFEYNPNTGAKQVSYIRIVNQILALLGYKLTRSERRQENGERHWYYRLEFVGCSQIYQFVDNEKIPIINIAEIESSLEDIFSYWTKQLSSSERNDEAAA